MSRYPALLLCLFAATLQAEESPPTEDRDLAYSLGVRLGERLREEVPDLQLDALLEGVRQAYRGEPLRLDPARIDALLADHEARLLSEAPQHLHPGGAVCLEFGVGQLNPLLTLARETYASVTVRPDLAGRPRVLIAR